MVRHPADALLLLLFTACFVFNVSDFLDVRAQPTGFRFWFRFTKSRRFPCVEDHCFLHSVIYHYLIRTVTIFHKA